MHLGPKVFICNLVAGSFPGCVSLKVQKQGCIFYQEDPSRDKSLPVASKKKNKISISLEWMDQEVKI